MAVRFWPFCYIQIQASVFEDPMGNHLGRRELIQIFRLYDWVASNSSYRMRPPILVRMLLSYSIKNHFVRIWTLRAHRLWFLTFSIVPELLQPHHSSFQYHHSNHVGASGQDRRECRQWNTPLWPFLARASFYQSAFSSFPPQ